MNTLRFFACLVCAVSLSGCKPPDVSHVTNQEVTELRQQVSFMVTFSCAKEAGTIDQEIDSSMSAQDYPVAVDIPYFSAVTPGTVLSRKTDVIGTATNIVKSLTEGGTGGAKVYVVKIGGKHEQTTGNRYVTSCGSGAALSDREFAAVLKHYQTNNKVVVEAFEQNPDGSYDRVYLIRNRALIADDVREQQPLQRYPVKVKVYAISYATNDPLKMVSNESTQHQVDVDVPKSVWENPQQKELWNSRAAWNSQHGTVMHAEIVERSNPINDAFFVKAILHDGRELILRKAAIRASAG